jgi:acetyltransferase EpsM
MAKKVIILGGMGNGTVVASAIIDACSRGQTDLEFAGYLNDGMEKGALLEGYPVLGKTSDCQVFLQQGYVFINTIFRIDGQQERLDMFESLGLPDSALATFVHPLTYIGQQVTLGPGTAILPNVSISSGVTFGKCCLVMVGATIGHTNTIGSYCHFAAQCCVGSYLNIADGVHIGLNATIREHLTIGENATVGMGAVLLKDVGELEIWAGNPAKFIRTAQ